MDDAKCTLDDAHGFHCSNMQLEQCQMVVYKFIAAVQYMHVLRQLRRGFCTIVLPYVKYVGIKSDDTAFWGEHVII